MKLARISIEKLFGEFDYDIELNQESGITILTGPNGYGKTTILNIIYHLLTDDMEYFDTLKYGSCKLTFDNGEYISLEDTILHNTLIDGPHVYYLSDQRLLKQPLSDGKSIPKKDADAFLSGIKYCAADIATLLQTKKLEEYTLTNTLTTTQYTRMKEIEPLSESEFYRRFDDFLAKYDTLINAGVYNEQIEYPKYETNQQYLTVFLQDFEERVKIYDKIIPAIEMIENIINNKGFNSKKIVIKMDIGIAV
jgi:energy-coupling factor transporter ATP-binding protein EcfA2